MLFSSDCSAGTGPVIEPPGDARANVPHRPRAGFPQGQHRPARDQTHATVNGPVRTDPEAFTGTYSPAAPTPPRGIGTA